MEDKVKILLCEDDENLGTLLCEYLIAKDYDAVLCPDGEVGFREFQKDKFDICVLDVMMPKKDGFTLASEIRQINSQVPIIFLTAAYRGHPAPRKGQEEQGKYDVQDRTLHLRYPEAGAHHR